MPGAGPVLSLPRFQVKGFGEKLEDFFVEKGGPAVAVHTHVDISPLDGRIQAAECEQEERVFIAADLWGSSISERGKVE